MADEPFALSTVLPPLPAEEGDYDAICATVMESERGRWFLQEYARRNRHSDTLQVLDAIGRIEGVIRGERGRDAYQSFRAELLEMARTIAETRAEVGEFRPAEAPPPAATREAGPAPDVAGAAERLKDVAWTMRERGLDPATCEQIEAVASSILAASALHDPDDRRARKLGEVLGYLERRINGMVAEVASSQAASEAPPAAAAETLQPLQTATGFAAPANEREQGAQAPTVETEEPLQGVAEAAASPVEPEAEQMSVAGEAQLGSWQVGSETVASAQTTRPVDEDHDVAAVSDDVAPPSSAIGEQTISGVAPPLDEAPAHDPQFPDTTSPLTVPEPTELPPAAEIENVGDEQAAAPAMIFEEERVELDVAPLVVAPLELQPASEETPHELDHAPLPVEPLFEAAVVAPTSDETEADAGAPSHAGPASEAEIVSVPMQAKMLDAGAPEPGLEFMPFEQATMVAVPPMVEATAASTTEPALPADDARDEATPVPDEAAPATLVVVEELSVPPLEAAPITTQEQAEPPVVADTEPAAPMMAQAEVLNEDAPEPGPEFVLIEQATVVAVTPMIDATTTITTEPALPTTSARDEVTSSPEEAAPATLVVVEELSVPPLEAAPITTQGEAEPPVVADAEPAAPMTARPADEVSDTFDEFVQEHAVVVIEPAAEAAAEVADQAAIGAVEVPAPEAIETDAAIAPASEPVERPHELEQSEPASAVAESAQPTVIDRSIERIVLAAEHEIAVIEQASDEFTAEASRDTTAATAEQRDTTPEGGATGATASDPSQPTTGSTVIAGEKPAPAPAWWAAPAPQTTPEPKELPSHETDILAGAWESAIAQPEIAAAALAPQSKPVEAPPALETAELSDPADFLFEPTPLPAETQSDAAGPVADGDEMTDIENELFAADDAATDAVPAQAAQPAPRFIAVSSESPATSTAASRSPTAAAPVEPASATATPQRQPAVALPIQPVFIPQPSLTQSGAQARPMAKTMPRPAPNDPLAALRAMSDEERIALFT